MDSILERDAIEEFWTFEDLQNLIINYYNFIRLSRLVYLSQIW